jgi:citrate synthase
MTSAGNPWMSAAAAAERLGVTRATLYAYVSRGQIRSQATPGTPRERGYSREDVERLRDRADARRDPERAAARALQWGVPVLESAITLIDGSRFYYRGHDAVELSRTRSVSEVAALIWEGSLQPRTARTTRNDRARKTRITRLGRLPFVARAQCALAFASDDDPGAFDLRPERVAAAGRRILSIVVTAATGDGSGGDEPDVALARAWKLDDGARAIVRAALILCADHELNVSAFTARAVASAGATPYAVVTAALSALSGVRHGGAGLRVEAMLASMRRSPDLARAIAARFERGERLEGFGHPLYPSGDPRAVALFDLLRANYGSAAELRFVGNFARVAEEATHERPNVDFALASVARVLRLPAGAPIVLFGVGRTIGWIGHALEQYATGHLIRPRARYVGLHAGPRVLPLQGMDRRG